MKPLHVLLSILMLGFFGRERLDAAGPPNVIFILADDLGIGNVGCYGADNYKTPNIDKLAASGIRFTHAYTAALCGPSRALIMSGRYAFRNGSTNQDACTRMDSREMVLPKIFKSAGYATSCVGKWGQLPGDPGDHGFDDYLRFNGSGVYWNPKDGKAERYRLNGEEKKLGDTEYMPDLCHDHLVGFLREHRKGPFFVYYPMSHVHGDLQPVPGGSASSQDLMADNVAYMDMLVGRLVAELESLKLRDNTLLIFMGDNGTGKGQADRATIGGRALSGSKGTMLEGGGLVPLIANWPGKTPTGVVCGDLVDSTDFIPTFASLLGTSLPPGVTFDGQNIVPKLLGQAGKNRDWIFNQLARMWYVRDDQWKLNEQGQLFDMSDAPFAEKLVATDSDASRAARLKLGAALAKLNPVGGIVDGGDGSGRHASKMKKKAEAALATPDDERGEKFDKIDTTKAGKISRDAFISSQSDAEGAAKRFDKYDVNGDGMLSRDEFVSRGSK